MPAFGEGTFGAGLFGVGLVVEIEDSDVTPTDILNAQPTLPAEGLFTEAELNFMSESPPGLFPENQDSNLGLFRKIWTDQIQAVINDLTMIYREAFVQTSEDFLDEWERLYDLPQATNLTTPQRRARLLTAARKGPFTRTKRREIIERFITATFGDSIALTPAGVPLVAAGVPLYNDVGDVNNLYSILEQIETFHYIIFLLQGMALDMEGLVRELKRFTPAGISFTILEVPDPLDPSIQNDTTYDNGWYDIGTYG
jgi:hypothetical protein